MRECFNIYATLYPNPYMVVTAKGYTKHYYAGTERLATVIGRGGFGDRIVPIEELSPSEESTIIKPFYNAYKGYDPFLHADVLQKPLTAIDITGQEFGILAKPVIVEIVDVHAKEDILLGSIKHNAFINAEEGTVFFTHSDHLGSAAWITNENGKCIQYIHYAPFGELMDNQRVGSYDERFKFTGKERDEESGYDYFGARYYTSNLSMWLSVDPLADIYPSYSPYLYCFGRIIMMSDPNGWGDPLTVMKVRRMATSNTFGMVRHYADGRPKPHQGVDYQAAIGTEIMAVKSGTIVGCDFEGKGDYGKTITLQFSDEDGNIGWAFYSHLSEIGVSINDEVKEGDIIGKTGTTGNAQGMIGEDQHLHFEYRTGGAKLGKGLTGRKDPNLIVDTKFEVDPNNQNKVKLVENQTYEE